MKYIAILNGKEIAVEITREKSRYCLTIENKSFTVDAFRPRSQSIAMLIEGRSHEVGLEKKNGNLFTVYLFNGTIDLQLIDAKKFQAAESVRPAGASGPLKIQAPMPGKIVKVSVQEKSAVREGDSLLIMEAMKMQNELKAPKSGTVSRIHVREGEPVSLSQTLMILE
ncbi:acetyl-CoA carboxylase biotin carboxyl carrier protein subunit [bacterium]|nr:acetyl-CoA carboxylase biotin carboxyl carrier protein subunit [bacterium]MCI0602015.1 acetyl-CoA carboxylase biotin carboxyl carrier protein subunit [bacterium]